MNKRVDYLLLVKLARTMGFTVTCPWNKSYQEDMTIWNRRLQTAPAMVAFCRNTADVQLCVRWCSDHRFPLRVRSGGHHHEGMSCDYGVLIIDLSLMNTIQYVDKHTAWIQPGKKLKDVYCELGRRNQIIPGGGCETVCVGGLTLGGGWGMYSRALGLTCDNILEAEMVMADGQIIYVSDAQHADLFRAIRGGGPGNFGIVTNFKFKLTDYSKLEQPPTEKWSGEEAKRQMMNVLELLDKDVLPLSTTLACRLYLDDAGVITFSKTTQIIEVGPPCPPVHSAAQAGHLHFTESKMHAHLETVTESVAAPPPTTSIPAAKPPDTCLTGPLPHKVSSAFVKNKELRRAGDVCYEFFQKNPRPFTNAETYISFHAFGGAISHLAPDASAFFYRDRKLLFQFQAWWLDPNDDATEQYVQWISNIRTTLKEAGVTDGGFFNFQDADVANDRYALMQYYYGGNTDELIKIKKKYDSHNFFNSGMSIPVKK